MVTSASLFISLLAPLLLGEMRTFSAADGDQTFEAELVSYDPTTEKVTVKRKGERKPIIFDASRISEEDRTYVGTVQNAKDIGSTVSVRLDKEVGSVAVYKSIPSSLNSYTYQGSWPENKPHETHLRKVIYTVTLTNKSNSAVGPFKLKLHAFTKEGAQKIDGVKSRQEVLDPSLLHKDDEDVILATRELTVSKIDAKGQMQVSFEPVEYIKFRFQKVMDAYRRVGSGTLIPRTVTKPKTVTDNFVGGRVALLIDGHEAKVAYEGNRSEVEKFIDAGLSTKRMFPSGQTYTDSR